MKKEENRINPFKLISNVDRLPMELKKEVMATISYVQLMADLGKLFIVDMAKIAEKMIVTPSEFLEGPRTGHWK